MGYDPPRLVSYPISRDVSARRLQKEQQLNELFNVRKASGIINRLQDESSQEALNRRKKLYSLRALEERQNRFIDEYPSYEKKRRSIYSSKGGNKGGNKTRKKTRKRR